MSGTGSGGGDKPIFEGELDLDAWDATFDSLTSGLDPAADPALDPILPVAAERAGSDFNLDEDVTSARISVPMPVKVQPTAQAITRKASPPPAAVPRIPATPSRDETDFSDLGFAGPPEALGSLLGQPPPLAPLHEVAETEVFEPTGFEEDEVFTSAVRPGAVMPGPDESREEEAVRVLPGETGFEAARPGTAHHEATRVAQVPQELLDHDETVDRPAARRVALGPIPDSGGASDKEPSDDTFDRANRTMVVNPNDLLLAEARGPERDAKPRSPAIVRRSTMGQPAPVPARDDDGYDDFGGGSSDFGGGESTRVADLKELEKLAARPAPAPPPPPEDDPYDDIEIGGEKEDDATGSTGTPSNQGRKFTRHVVRRSTAETKPPPVADVVLDLDAEDEPAKGPSVSQEFNLDAAFDAFDAEESAEAAAVPAAAVGGTPVPSGDDVEVAPEVISEIDADLVAEEIAEPVVEALPDAVPEAVPDIIGEQSIDDDPGFHVYAAEPAIAAPEVGLEADDDGFGGDEEDDGFSIEDAAARTTIGVPPPPPSAPIIPPPPSQAPRSRPSTAPPQPWRSRPATGQQPPVAVEPPAAVELELEPVVEATEITAPPQPPAVAADPNADLPPLLFGDDLPPLDLDGLKLPEHSELITGDTSDEAAASLLALDRELELIDEPAQVAVLRIEAGRLYERLGDAERARASYEAALLADPRVSAAFRGLRRIARGAGDLAEATRQLDAELGLAGPLERRALALHRVDLLMASGEQDLARVAVGELLDEAKGDVRAQLAQLELAFLDGRADELSEALERLGAALADPSVRAAADVARGHLLERTGDVAGARAAFEAAAAADPAARAARFGLLRVTAPGDGLAAVSAELAGIADDPAVRAALLLRGATPATRTASVAAAAVAAGGDPVVQAALVASIIARGIAHGEVTDELITAAETAADPALRRQAALWAAARLPVEDPRAAGLYSVALATLPRDEHAAAALADRWIGAGDLPSVAELLAVRASGGSGAAAEHDRLRAATWYVAAGRPDDAAHLFESAAVVDSPASVDAWGEVLGAIGRLPARAELFVAAAGRDDERLDPKLWAGKAALALDRAADPAVPATLAAALDAWTKVAELEGDVERAHARSLALAATLGDPDVLGDTLARAQAAAQPPAAAGSLAVLRARTAVASASADVPGDWARADEILRELPADDPRRLATAVTLAARSGRWNDVAHALEDHAGAIAARSPMEAALLRYRAAGILLDRGDDPARAAALLAQIADEHPDLGFVHDLVASARRRLGDAAGPARASREPAKGADAFARLVRDAEHAVAQSDSVAALALYGRALDLRPHDPLVAEPLGRIARMVREAGPITSLTLAELRLAEDSGDAQAKADAYEALGRIDRDLRGDDTSALMAFESAAEADPTRHGLLRELERAYTVEQRWADLARLRGRQLAALPASDGASDGVPGGWAGSPGDDAIALALDRAQLLERLERPDDELRLAYQVVVERAPRARQALFHLESLVRRGGSSPDLATLEDAIASYFLDDVRTRSAFLTRGGETLTDLGRIDEALAHFRAADELRGGHVAALEGWRDAALRGQLWIDFSEAASREARLTGDMSARARLYHLAGVALMDRALAGERAADMLRAALDADPRHVDAFVRLRLLLDEQGEHERLAELLEQRLLVEDDRAEQLVLHRAIAEMARNFLEDRESAKRHYRAIVEAEPGDLRAIAALSDIAWEQGAWQECAEALDRRARLEREPHVLRNIYFRLGVIHAERLPNAPAAIAAFQRVLSYDGDDELALERLADLGIATEQWKMALGACERLVKNETVAARKVAHLHRVGRIFAEGFGDRRRAERAYQLAVDAAPDSDVALGALIDFYQAAGDVASIRVHLGLVAASMRNRLGHSADPTALKVLARVARARHEAGVAGQGVVARAAGDVARLAGVDPGDPPQLPPTDLRALTRPEADELIWPASVTPELRQIFLLLGDRLAKHVGIDLRPYGVTRGDRLRPQQSPVAAAAQEVADGLGLGEIDVYVSSRQPFAMVAEPTSPISLVLGSEIASPDRLSAVRFAAGGALVLARAQLAIPARLPVDDLGVLVIALLRLFQPDLPYLAVDNDQVGSQLQRLKRLVPSGLMSELRPYALGVHAAAFDHRVLARDLEIAAHRAGLLAAGGAAAPLRVLLARAGAPDLASGMSHHSVSELVRFAVGEDLAALAALG